jgi:hypothetical protein
MMRFSAFHVWAVVLLSSNLQNLVVNRFRRRTDADECFQLLRRSNPDKHYTVLYAPPEKDLQELVESQLSNLESGRSSFVKECSETLEIVWYRSECIQPPEMETVIGLYQADDGFSTESVHLGYSGVWWNDCGYKSVDPPLWWTEIPFPAGD